MDQMSNVTLACTLLLMLLGICARHAQAQFFYHQTLLGGGAYHQQPQAHFAALHDESEIPPYRPLNGAAPHPSVVANSQWEAQLPPELSKSARFFSNPHIAAGLAQQSLLTKKEMPVVDREAEKIPREQVYKIFKNAGWIKRR